MLTLLISLVAIGLFMSWVASRPRGSQLLSLANVAEGTHSGKLTLLADATVATRYLLVKSGSDTKHFAVAALASDFPIGFCTDAPDAAEDSANINLLGASHSTQLGVANGAIAYEANVYTAGAGKVGPEPTLAGTYYLLGTSLTTTAADGDTIEIDPIKPIKVVVMATLTSAQNATAAASDLATSEALANALKANYNALQADFAALRAALAQPALVKIL